MEFLEANQLHSLGCSQVSSCHASATVRSKIAALAEDFHLSPARNFPPGLVDFFYPA
jgi:hypothetical protein